jgi:alkanesulfonate monooxygenase SsuD/methylene tetrahydromethanopterin reductase-like flavin-dependent oxidoreductase (luciferase family)
MSFAPWPSAARSSATTPSSSPTHLIFKAEGEAPHGPWECWSLLAALAASTRRMEIGTLVTCAGFRNPGLLAKMAETVDEISGGRLILGLGAGWHEPEYRAFGYPFERRFDRFEEALRVIRPLLTTGKVDHHGEFYQLENCELRPRGPRPGGADRESTGRETGGRETLPILIGALSTGKRMLRLAAEYADQWNGWLVHGRSHPDEVPPLTAAVDAACAKAGRDPATLVRTLGVMVDQRPASERDTVHHVNGTAEPMTGSVPEIAAQIRAVAGHGISHLQVVPTIQGLAGVDAFAEVLAELDR